MAESAPPAWGLKKLIGHLSYGMTVSPVLAGVKDD
jgi:hypothetical protein